MEMTQFSVGNHLYKVNRINEKGEKSEGINKYSKDEFSKELKNYSANSEKSKSINPSQQEKPKESSKDCIVNDEKAHKEEGTSTSEDMQSLINLIIAFLNREDTSMTEINSSNLTNENKAKVELQPLLDLLGSEKNVNSLLELLTLINEDFAELENNSESLMKLLNSKAGIDKDELIGHLQQIASMKDDNKEDDSFNIPRRMGMESKVIDESRVVTGVENNDEGVSKDVKFSKETAILNKVINTEEKDSKVTRVADFMSSLENNILKSGEVASEKPIAITKSELNSDVIKALSYMDKNGIKDLTVKIYPKELGEISISVSMEQGALKAMIKATSKETIEMLSLGLKDINEKLNGSNIKIESVNIGLYEEDSTYFAHENNQGKAYENSGQSRDGEGRQSSGGNIIEGDDIEEVTEKKSNEIDLLV